MLRRTVFLGTLILASCGPSNDPKKNLKTPVVAVKPDVTKDEAPKADGENHRRTLNESPNGDIATIVRPGNVVKIESKAHGTLSLESDLLHPPAGNRALIGISAQTLVYLEDGRLLLGIGDGTLVALDTNYKPQWMIGFRGAVMGVIPYKRDRVIITTQSGVVASVGAKDGQVFWEKQITGGPLSPAAVGPDQTIYVCSPRGVLAFSENGALVFTHAAAAKFDVRERPEIADDFQVDEAGLISGHDIHFNIKDPHPPIVDTTPIYLVDYDKVLNEPVYSVIPAGPNDLWLNVADKKKEELVKFSSGKTQRFKLPKTTAKSERRHEEEKPEKPIFQFDNFVIGPNGNPWILARKLFGLADFEEGMWNREAKAAILEFSGTSIQERNDLNKAFGEHFVNTDSSSQIRAADNGSARIFCFGNNYVEPTYACAIYDGPTPKIVKKTVGVRTINVVGKYSYVVFEDGTIERLEGNELVSFAKPVDAGDQITAIGGLNDNDLWLTTLNTAVYHWDGTSFKTYGVPEPIASGVVAIAPNDVWSRNGHQHWDGNRWSLIAGSQGAAGLVARGPNDIWVGNSTGLFHSKPTTRTLLRWPEAQFVETKPLEAPKPLTIGAPQTGYTVTKTSLIMKNAPPISTAKRFEVARDGTLWLESWDRLVEVDAEGQTILLDDTEKRIAFDRWFYPEGSKRGIFTRRERESESNGSRDALHRFDDGKPTKMELQLSGHDIMAIAGNAAGTTWILGSAEAASPYALHQLGPQELSAHALVRADEKSPFQMVMGLPSMSYQSVAVTPDGGGFFVGALNPGTTGEGVIVHARGRLGTESVVRYRAPATIFAVAALSNDEAWAVGAMGVVIHIKGNTIERNVIPGNPWLRAVVVTSPNDVWLAGDDATLLHYDGAVFHPVPQPLGPRAAFSGLGFSRGVLWAASPSGILRVTKSK